MGQMMIDWLATLHDIVCGQSKCQGNERSNDWAMSTQSTRVHISVRSGYLALTKFVLCLSLSTELKWKHLVASLRSLEPIDDVELFFCAS